MIHLPLSGSGQALLAIAIVAGMFVMFLRERLPPDVIAMAGAAVMLFLGLVPYKDATEALSNSAPWTIAFMLLIMGALVRTGALAAVTRMAERHIAKRPAITVVFLFGVTMLASGVLNNTPVVAVMIPIFMQVARKLEVPPSRFLMPLSYLTILAGMFTLIGTSTNILVDGVVRRDGLEPFGIFEIFPLGLTVAAVGTLFLALFSRRLVPDRQSLSFLLGGRPKMKYFTEIAIPEGSSLIGSAVLTVDAFRHQGVRVIDVLRGDASLRRNLEDTVLAAGDRVVLRTEMSELLTMQQNSDLRIAEKISSVET
ncbi:MAG TPA: SLC13 family permease, partial [Paenirhodobacter sp.]